MLVFLAIKDTELSCTRKELPDIILTVPPKKKRMGICSAGWSEPRNADPDSDPE